jgi:hypothetical protein
MAAHANHFVVLFVIPATLLLLTGRESSQRRILFLSGLLYGLGFLIKQQGIFFGVFGGLYLIWAGVRSRNIPALVKDLFAFGMGMVLPFVALCLLMKMAGVFNTFWFWTFTYARSYVAFATWTEGFEQLYLHLRVTFWPSGGIWFLAIIGLLLGFRDQQMRGRTFFVAFLWLFSFFGTATGLYFRSHYFILVLPASGLLVGLAVSELQKRLLSRTTAQRAGIIPLILLGAMLSWNVYLQRNFFS